MKGNLNHLKAGGSIETLPHEFESLVITLMPKTPKGKVHHSDPKENEEAPEAPLVEKPISFIGKIKLWLSSSWKMRWRDL
ncbi:MAG: hypothetical protein ACJAWS_001252 [Oleiphilaceae bacterium]|jgi:hypothetical protein